MNRGEDGQALLGRVGQGHRGYVEPRRVYGAREAVGSTEVVRSQGGREEHGGCTKPRRSCGAWRPCEAKEVVRSTGGREEHGGHVEHGGCAENRGVRRTEAVRSQGRRVEHVGCAQPRNACGAQKLCEREDPGLELVRTNAGRRRWPASRQNIANTGSTEEGPPADPGGKEDLEFEG
ncbi:hypothetical protein Dimus_032268, partial [Dionaea muscipula]